MKKLVSCITCCVFVMNLIAAINPVNGSVLNYTQVMFEYNEVPGADRYVITIKGIASTTINVENRSLAFMQSTGLQFGEVYQWFYEAYSGERKIAKSNTYTFSIGTSFQTSNAWFKSSIDVDVKDGYHDGIIFLDYSGMAINRNGEPVWYMPISKDSLDHLKMRNVRMTPGGTITYLDNTDCFERSLDGSIMWRAPNDGRISGDKQEYYHHEFFKMNDGTYFTSGYRFIGEPNFYDASVFTKVRYNTIIQYNRKGEVIWHWDESRTADKKDLYGDSGPTATEVAGTHLNGFAYYAPDDAIIASFRDNSSILKISHANGAVLYNVRDSLKKYYPDEIPFSGQHGPSLLRNGDIVIYNNNLNKSGKTGAPTYPVVKVFKQPSDGRQTFKQWDYECYSEKYPGGIFGKEGYAAQVPYNDNLLVCMGGANYIFEVNPDRKIVWQCSLQRYDSSTSSWTNIHNYRCSYASSLYPYYFTVQHIRATDKQVDFTLNNEGSNDQAFLIKLQDAKGNTLSASAMFIESRQSAAVELPMVMTPSLPVTITVYTPETKDAKKTFTIEKFN